MKTLLIRAFHGQPVPVPCPYGLGIKAWLCCLVGVLVGLLLFWRRLMNADDNVHFHKLRTKTSGKSKKFHKSIKKLN